MVARQQIQKRPLLVSQMVDEWLGHYRRLGYEVISYASPESPKQKSEVRADLTHTEGTSSIPINSPTVVAQTDSDDDDVNDDDAPAPKRLRLDSDSALD